MAETIVSLALEKISDLLIHEAVFLHGVEDEVERLKAELERMESFLKDAELKQDQKELDRTLAGQIRDLAFQAEDVLDSFVSQVAHQRRGCHGIFKRFTKPFHLHRIGGQIKQIQTKLEDISKTLPTYNEISKGEGCSSISNMPQQQQHLQQLRRIYSHVEEDEDVVSLEGITTNVLAQLMTEEDRLHVVVSIVGMGGIGKTTLAMKIYHHTDVRRYFDCVVWAVISQQCKPRDVFHDVLFKVASLSKEEREEINKLKEDELIRRVHDALKEKRYLVVLDDIWKSEDWMSLKHAFPRGKMGSKILFTTRNKDVALHADPRNSPIELPLLADDESWNLFSKKAFPRNNMDSHASSSEQFEKLGREMVKKCGGLPLAIVVLGSLLATKRTPHQWVLVHRNLHANINEFLHQDDRYGKVNQILGLSYNDLPFCLKQCFLYLSHYPEDWEFSKRDVIRLWVAEGFIPPSSGAGERAGTMEDAAEAYLEELINRNLVQVDKRDYTGEGVKTCRLHDLLREMCLLKAEDERFLKSFRVEVDENNDHRLSAITSSSTSSNKVRRIAIHLSKRDIVDKHYFSMSVPLERDFPNIRSLLLCSDAIWVRSDIPKRNNFRLLRVLKLLTWCNEGIMYIPHKVWIVPSVIGKLVHLRYLGLEYRELVLPRSIGNLRSLYTLNIRASRGLTIPNVLYKLENLRHLLVSCGMLKFTRLFRVDTLKNIETLKTVRAGTLILGGGAMPKLTSLRSLGIRFETAEEVDAILVNSNIVHHLSSLKMGMRSFVSFPDLTPLTQCYCLFKLSLYGKIEDDLQLGPHHHVLKFLPETIVKLELWHCLLKHDPMDVLEKLPHLRILSMFEAYMGTKMVCSANEFPQLQEIEISAFYKLEEWKIAEGAMPRLKRLHMEELLEMKMLPEGLEHITSLHELHLIKMKRSLVERIQGEELYKVRHVPSISIDDIIDTEEE